MIFPASFAPLDERLNGKRFLSVGFDDSNHLGQVKAEIDVAVFSLYPEDRETRRHPSRRKYEETKQWLQAEERAYRYTILTGSQLMGRQGKYNSTNLPFAAPYLVRSYLASLPDGKRRQIGGLGLYFDGRISDEDIASLKFCFRDFPNFEAEAFVKKSREGRNRKSSKRFFCPAVVYRADTLASDFFRSMQPLEKVNLAELVRDPLFVRI